MNGIIATIILIIVSIALFMVAHTMMAQLQVAMAPIAEVIKMLQ